MPKKNSPAATKTEPADLIGRQRQWTALQQALTEASTGRGGLFLLGGEAGVGKSLLAEAALGHSGFAVFTGRAVEESAPPYSPIAMALRSCLQQDHQTLLEAGPLSPYLGVLVPELGLPPEPAEPDTLLAALATALKAVAHNNPVALFLDDLHWADSATLELMPALDEHLGAAPVLVLCTYRSDEIPRGHRLRWLRNELRRRRRLREIILEPLDPEQTQVLAQRALGAAPSQALAQLVFKQTQGLPLFVEELASTLAASNLLQQGEAGLELAAGTDIPVPANVRDTIILRLDNLSEEARRLLEVAAVGGVEFDLEMVLELVGAETGLDQLLESQIITETDQGHGRFRHALTREAIRSQISWSRRRRLNGQIAVYLARAGASPQRTAEHWLAAGDHPQARRALLQAAESACDLKAYRDAARAAHRALEIWPEGEDSDRRLDALERLGHCAQLCGQLSDAIRTWSELADCLPQADHARLANAKRALATLFSLQGAWNQAIEARQKAAAAYEAAESIDEAAAEWLAAAGQYTGALQLQTAVEAARRAGALAQKIGNPALQGRSLGLEGSVLAMQGHIQQGRQTVQRGLAIALEHQLVEAASEIYYRLGSTFEYASDFPASRDAYHTAYDYCHNQGAANMAQVCLGCMAYSLYRTGDWLRALEVCQEVQRNPEAPEAASATAQMVSGLIYTQRGEFRQARKLIDACLEKGRRLHLTILELITLAASARLAKLQGEVEGAENGYKQMLELWEQTEDRHDLIPYLCGAASFFAERGQEREMARCGEILSVIAASTGNSEAMAGLAWSLGETALLQDRQHEATQHLTQALEQLSKLNLPLEETQLADRLAIALVRTEQKEQAATQLHKAYRSARRLGARPLAGQLAQALKELGLKAEDSRQATVEERALQGGLTRRQVEIGRLIAEGLTNKEIGQKLFLSTRTVDMHVRNIFNRLNCRSRTEAVRKIDQLGLLDK